MQEGRVNGAKLRLKAYIGGVIAPFAMRLESFLGDSPQQGPQVTELHNHHDHRILTLHAIESNQSGSC